MLTWYTGTILGGEKDGLRDCVASRGEEARGGVGGASREGDETKGGAGGAWNAEPVGLEGDGVTPRSQGLGGVARSRAAAILEAEASGDSDGEGALLRAHVLVGVALREVAADDPGDSKSNGVPPRATSLGGVVCLEGGTQGAGEAVEGGAVLRAPAGGVVGAVLRTEGMVGTDHKDGEV